MELLLILAIFPDESHDNGLDSGLISLDIRNLMTGSPCGPITGWFALKDGVAIARGLVSDR